MVLGSLSNCLRSPGVVVEQKLQTGLALNLGRLDFNIKKVFSYLAKIKNQKPFQDAQTKREAISDFCWEVGSY